jgi:hypothetical protein
MKRANNSILMIFCSCSNYTQNRTTITNAYKYQFNVYFIYRPSLLYYIERTIKFRHRNSYECKKKSYNANLLKKRSPHAFRFCPDSLQRSIHTYVFVYKVFFYTSISIRLYLYICCECFVGIFCRLHKADV